jgi:uncharacterized protein YerC
MTMTQFRDNPFSSALDVVATLRDRQIEARIAELKREDEMTVALRQMLRNGADINSLSDASGLTVKEIERQIERELHFGEDMATLAGPAELR